MKQMKKIASLLLALVMVFSMGLTVFAVDGGTTTTDGKGSITITNATVGKNYSVYKVFDLTHEGDAVAYSYTKTGVSDTLYVALSGDSSPFTLTATTTENVYNVALKDGKNVADVSKFLTDNKGLLTQTGESIVAESSTVKFEDLPYGYYYITSDLGAFVTIDSVKSDVNVIDKNQTPGWDPEDPKNPDESSEQGKFVAAAEDGTYGKTSTAAINDTAFFKINAYAPKYAGDKLVNEYTFTDTLDNGFTYNGDLKVTLGDIELTEDYTVKVENQTITVVVKASDMGDAYPAEAHISITYSAAVDKDAVYDNVNTVSMKWTVYPNDNNGDPDPDQPPYDPNDPEKPSEDPKDPENPGDSRTDTYVFGFNIQKYKESATSGNELTGAKFKLYASENGDDEIPVVKISDGVYRVAVAGETGVEIEAGSAKIFGLDAKTYYLEETVAPDGYNILTERQPVEIKADTETEDNVDDNGILNDTIAIINNAGTLLPSTGGIGTTLFYVLGSLLVLGSVVLLVVKKRMNQTEC